MTDNVKVYTEYSTRFCVRCQKTKTSKGGVLHGPMFTCAECKSRKYAPVPPVSCTATITPEQLKAMMDTLREANPDWSLTRTRARALITLMKGHDHDNDLTV